MASVVGQWLTLGGAAAYMFGYPPGSPSNEGNRCAGYGDMMLFLDDNGRPGAPLPVYYAAQLLTQRWTMPGHDLHELLSTKVDGVDGDEVIAFSTRRPDGRIGVLLVNRSPRRTYELQLVDAGEGRRLDGPAELDLYGPEQYAWKDLGERSHPVRDEPPAHTALPAGPLAVTLPPDTIAVVSFQVAPF